MRRKNSISDLQVINNNKDPGTPSPEISQDIIDRLPGMAWRSGPDAKRDYFNPAWIAFTGRTLDQEAGGGWEQDIHPEDRQQYYRICTQASEKYQPFEVEYRLRDHRGQYRWVLDAGHPLIDSEGHFSGYLGTCLDITDRKEMAKSLTAEGEMFKNLFEYAQNAVVIIDQGGTVCLANQQAEQIFGCPRASIVGKAADALLLSESGAGQPCGDSLRACLASLNAPENSMPSSNNNINLALAALRADGTRVPVDVNLRPLNLGDDVRIMATISDTTGRRQAEAIINDWERLLITAATSAPIVFFKIDKDGILQLSLGKSLARKLNDVDPIGKSIYTLYRNAPDVIRNIERALKGETFTTVIENGDNTFETTYVAVKNEQGEVNSVFGVATDVTRHRQVEAALRESEDHFRTIFNDTILGIKLIDPSGRIVETNPALQEMLGYTAEELQQMSFQDLTHPEDTPIMSLLLDNLLSGKMEHFRVEKRYLHKNGQVIWGRLAMSLFRRDDGTPVFGIGMIENITAQKQAEAELAELQRRMIDSAEMERLNLAQDLHDGPLQDLQSIAFETAMLESIIQDPEGLSGLKRLQDEVHKVSQSLRLVCGDLRPPALAPFGLEKTIRSHAERFKEQHPEMNVNLDLMSDGKLLSERVRLALFRIYQHAMTNIFRHAQAKNVSISFSFDENEIHLKIQDDGKGFKVPGRWIALVREGHFGLVGSIERAESVGGKFEIRSSPGSGTVIHVTVPRREEEQLAVRERFRASYSE